MNGVMERWPNFFIVGASKAGTTSFYEILKTIPGIYMSPFKEPNFFAPNSAKNYKKRISEKKKYLDLFKDVNDEKIVGESTPTYLRDPDSARLISQTVKNARILISLRDPVERAYSQYFMALRRGKTVMTFSEEWRKFKDSQNKNGKFYSFVLEPGLYYTQVKRFFDNFNSDQIKIIIFEEFIKEPNAIIREILKFLEISSEIKENSKKQFNPYLAPRSKIILKTLRNPLISKVGKKIISTSTADKLVKKFLVKKQPKPIISDLEKKPLIDFYQDDVQRLQKLLNRKLPWKNFKNKI